MPIVTLAVITFDWTISLGNIVNAVILLLGAYGAAMRLYHVMDKRVDQLAARVDGHAKQFKDQIDAHAETLKDQATRIERWETSFVRVVGDLQRVIGRMEIVQDRRWDGTDRRGHIE